MTDIYYNTSLTIPVGSKVDFADLQFDAVDGSVYRVKELSVIIDGSADSGNAQHCMWLSVLKDGRADYDPWTEGFAGDIIGALSNIKANRPYGIFEFETPEQGYLADDPYFESAFRLGVSGDANTAGGAVLVHARIVAERVKATTEIRQVMYNRSYS